MSDLHWASQYIGIPYLAGGSDVAGLDCWGLVRLVLKEQCGLDMPSIAVAQQCEQNEIAIRRCFEGWTKSDGRREFDILTMRNAFGHHVGIVARADTWNVDILHCDEPQSSIATLADLGLLGYQDFKGWRYGKIRKNPGL